MGIWELLQVHGAFEGSMAFNSGVLSGVEMTAEVGPDS